MAHERDDASADAARSQPARGLGEPSRLAEDPPLPTRYHLPQRADAPTDDHRPARVAVEPASFGSSLGWAAVNVVLPGSGLLRTRFVKVGVAMLVVIALLLGAIGLAAWLAPDRLLALVLQPTVLTGIGVGLVVAGIVWVVTIVATHLSLRPAGSPGWKRALGGVVVGALSLLVALPTFWAARTVHDTSSLISGVFSQAGAGLTGDDPVGNVTDPWANKPRLNVLILGGDSGQARSEELGARTDTVILASIDTDTGATTLFSLPRQTQRMPFAEGSALAAEWPNGFRGSSSNDAEYFLNAMYHNVPLWAPDAIPSGVLDPGAEVLKESVGTALGLEVDYFAMVNMDGFIEFINALGGVTVNISKPVPVGGVTSTDTPPDRWLSPGPNQHLNGVDALWFARGRYGEATGDYARMARQRCLIRALVEQTSPTKVLANYEALTKAGQNIVETDVPNSMLPALVTLANRVRTQTIASVSFENDKDGFSTSRPDWDLVRERVDSTLNPPTPEPQPTASGTATAEPDATDPTTQVTVTPIVVDECAYNPDAAE